MMLGNVTMLLLADNCLTNVRGLERLYSLKKIDLRNNKISNLLGLPSRFNGVGHGREPHCVER